MKQLKRKKAVWFNGEHEEISEKELQDFRDNFGVEAAMVYKDNIGTIGAKIHNVKKGIVDKRVYNCRIPFSEVSSDESILSYVANYFDEHISHRLDRSCKIQLQYGFLLNEYDKVKGGFNVRYFMPSESCKGLDSPLLIAPSKVSISGDIFKQHILSQGKNPLELIMQQREDTKSHALCVTNVFIVVTFGKFPIMGVEYDIADLHENIKRRRCVHDPSSGVNGNLCFFNVISYTQCKELENRQIINNTKKLVEKLIKFCGEEGVKCKSYEYYKAHGLAFMDPVEFIPTASEEVKKRQKDIWQQREFITLCEVAFQTNLQVYQIDPDQPLDNLRMDQKVILSPINISRFLFDKTVHMLISPGGHCYYLTNPKHLAGGFSCPMCNRMFESARLLNKHKKAFTSEFVNHRLTCGKDQTLVYPGGFKSPPKTIFQELSEMGINIPEELQGIDEFCTFDIESSTKPISSTSAKCSTYAEHEICSFSVGSSVPGFEQPYHLSSEDDPAWLVRKMIEYLLKVRKKAAQIYHSKMDPYYQMIQARIIFLGGVPFIHEAQQRGDYALSENLLNQMKDNVSTPPADLEHKIFLNLHRIPRGNFPQPRDLPQEEIDFQRHLDEILNPLGLCSRDLKKISPDYIANWSDMPNEIYYEEMSSEERDNIKSSDNLEEMVNNLVIGDEAEERELNRVLGNEIEGEEEGEDESTGSKKSRATRIRENLIKKYKCAQDTLREYGDDLKVVGYSSSSYDLNVILPYWPGEMVKAEEEVFLESHSLRHCFNLENEDEKKAFEEIQKSRTKVIKSSKKEFSIIKKGTKYASIQAPCKLHFLDLLHYLGPGVSYAKFLNLMSISAGKGYFPYQVLNTRGWKDSRDFPSYSDFESEIKHYNVLEDDWYPFCNGLYQFKYIPLFRLVMENYADDQIAKENNCKSFGEWYDKREGIIKTCQLELMNEMQMFDKPIRITHQQIVNRVKCFNIDCKNKQARPFIYPDSRLCEVCYEDVHSEIEVADVHLYIKIRDKNERDTHLPYVSRDETYHLTNVWALKSPFSLFEENNAKWTPVMRDKRDKLDIQYPDKKWECNDSTGAENYIEQKRLWREQNIETMGGYLRHYNDQDVYPFVQGVKILKKLFREDKIELFHGNISLPNIARNILFREAQKNNAKIWIPGKDDGEHEKLFRKTCTGGLSAVFKRSLIAYADKMRRGEGDLCKKIVGLDCNSLYLGGIGSYMPTGSPIYYYRGENGEFKLKKFNYYSNQFLWLDFLSSVVEKDMEKENEKYIKAGLEPYTRDHVIRHERNSTLQVHLGVFRPDGVRYRSNFTDKELRDYPGIIGMIYEYQGCLIHGHENCTIYRKLGNDARLEAKRKIRYKNTMAKIAFYEKMGYVVRFIWQCQWETLVNRKFRGVYKFIEKNLPPFYCKLYESGAKKRELLKELENINFVEDLIKKGRESIFGFVQVDIEVPPEKYNKFHEMPPLFCREEIDPRFHDPSADPPGDKKLPTYLIPALAGEKMLLSTDLLKLYLELGLRITKVHCIYEFIPQKCFEGFVKAVTEGRKNGDRPGVSKGVKLKSLFMKLTGNAGYGGLIMSKNNHENVKFCFTKYRANLEWQKPLYSGSDNISDTLCEVRSKKPRIIQDTCPILGKQVLDYAKKVMLEFYYCFLDKFLPRRSFELTQTDTDSYYLGLGANAMDPETGEDISIEVLVRERLKEKYMAEKGKWMVQCLCSQLNKKSCDNPNCDLRLTGLFKREGQGCIMISLCSKTYSVISCDPYQPVISKFSSKGIPNRMLKHAPIQDYHNVLKTQTPMDVSFPSIVKDIKSQKVVSRTMCRAGISAKYLKRKLEPDLIHTMPLGLIVRSGLEVEAPEMKRRRIEISLERQKLLTYKKLFPNGGCEKCECKGVCECD